PNRDIIAFDRDGVLRIALDDYPTVGDAPTELNLLPASPLSFDLDFAWLISTDIDLSDAEVRLVQDEVVVDSAAVDSTVTRFTFDGPAVETEFQFHRVSTGDFSSFDYALSDLFLQADEFGTVRGRIFASTGTLNIPENSINTFWPLVGVWIVSTDESEVVPGEGEFAFELFAGFTDVDSIDISVGGGSLLLEDGEDYGQYAGVPGPLSVDLVYDDCTLELLSLASPAVGHSYSLVLGLGFDEESSQQPYYWLLDDDEIIQAGVQPECEN
ncbi:MAG: hypothetical protein KC561_20600, partial [Myxococcales bacterium]|nr:hypothetical protein [Myxococcales bacterium]